MYQFDSFVPLAALIINQNLCGLNGPFKTRCENDMYIYIYMFIYFAPCNKWSMVV